MKKVVTETAEFSIDENRVLLIVVLPNVVIDFEDALDNALVIRHLTAGQKVLKLTDSRNPWSITKKAKKVLIEENEKQTLARAIVVSNAFSSNLRNLFLKMQEQKAPGKFFTDFDEAYQWLLQQATKE